MSQFRSDNNAGLCPEAVAAILEANRGQRLKVAELSESAGQSEDVKFRIIDPPILPAVPIAPNRPLLIVAVLLGGLGAGAGLAFLRNQIEPVFSDVRDVRNVTGLAVLGPVLTMRTEHQLMRQKLEIGQIAGYVIALCGLFVVVLLFHQQGSRLIQAVI